jgi:hypothetical protein
MLLVDGRPDTSDTATIDRVHHTSPGTIWLAGGRDVIHPTIATAVHPR